MLNKYARWIFAEPITRLAVRLRAAGVTPNAVTLTGFVLTVLSALIIAQGYFFWGGLLLWVAALSDMLDGTLARLGKPSTFGAFLDSTLDRYSESATFLALAYYYLTQTQARTELVLIFFILVGSLMVSYTRARAEGLNVECKAGLLQRPERLVLVIAGLLTGWMLPVLWILAIFTNFTALQRIYEVYWRTHQAQVTLPPQEKP
jgi:CDP-diacylglycerol--glycerol-3-phosphate 3-phosphatidyltransferase